MVTKEKILKDARISYELLTRDSVVEPIKGKVYKDNGDGSFLLTECKKVVTKLKASDYSVKMVLDTAPELMNEKLVLHNADKVRMAEEFEKTAQAAKDVKDYLDSLPRVDDNVVEDEVEPSNT